MRTHRVVWGHIYISIRTDRAVRTHIVVGARFTHTTLLQTQAETSAFSRLFPRPYRDIDRGRGRGRDKDRGGGGGGSRWGGEGGGWDLRLFQGRFCGLTERCYLKGITFSVKKTYFFFEKRLPNEVILYIYYIHIIYVYNYVHFIYISTRILYTHYICIIWYTSYIYYVIHIVYIYSN